MSMGRMSKCHLKKKSEMKIGEHSELCGNCGRVRGDWVRGCQHEQELAPQRNGSCGQCVISPDQPPWTVAFKPFF